jgi:hypothetical protein
MIINRIGDTTSETNLNDVKQYCTYCEKYNSETDKVVFSTRLYYLESDKDNVESLFNDVYTAHITPTPFSAETLRSQRRSLLKNSDWTVMPDSPLSDSKKAEWTTYRQALRDITNGIDTEEKALAVTFPTPPA